MFVSTSGTSAKSPVSCYLDDNRGQLKKENKLACQNINQKKNDSAKQGELVVIKRRYRITRWKSFCDRDLLKRGVLCLPSIRLITQHRRRIARLCMLYKTLNNEAKITIPTYVHHQQLQWTSHPHPLKFTPHQATSFWPRTMKN